MISLPYVIFNLLFIIVVSVIMSILASGIYLKEYKRNYGICPKCDNIWIKKEVYKGDIIYQCKNGHKY